MRGKENDSDRQRSRGISEYQNRWDLKVNSGNRDESKLRQRRWFKEDLNGRVSTFFFINFPYSWDDKRFWTLFQYYGSMVDVYISRKRNNAGKRFGFARFLGVKDLSDGGKLKEIWIGYFKLQLNLAKFDRRKLEAVGNHDSKGPAHFYPIEGEADKGN